MPAQPVAGEDDIKAAAGSKMLEDDAGAPLADTGTWTAGSVQTTSYAKLKASGEAVVHTAKCTFSFSGSKGNTTVKGTSTVTLTKSGRRLQKSQNSALVDGDSASDKYGNQLSVSSTRKLRCAP